MMGVIKPGPEDQSFLTLPDNAGKGMFMRGIYKLVSQTIIAGQLSSLSCPRRANQNGSSIHYIYA